MKRLWCRGARWCATAMSKKKGRSEILRDYHLRIGQIADDGYGSTR
jgi:hypothetical protein